MIRKFVNLLEHDGDELWRHYCKIRAANNQKDFWDAIKAIVSIIDRAINRFSNTT